jgi:hypothetical protein
MKEFQTVVASGCGRRCSRRRDHSARVQSGQESQSRAFCRWGTLGGELRESCYRWCAAPSPLAGRARRIRWWPYRPGIKQGLSHGLAYVNSSTKEGTPVAFGDADFIRGGNADRYEVARTRDDREYEQLGSRLPLLLGACHFRVPSFSRLAKTTKPPHSQTLTTATSLAH